MRNPVYANIIASNVVRLQREFPALPISTHIISALDGREMYNMSDREFATLLSDYIINQELFDSYMSDDSPMN